MSCSGDSFITLCGANESEGDCLTRCNGLICSGSCAVTTGKQCSNTNTLYNDNCALSCAANETLTTLCNINETDALCLERCTAINCENNCSTTDVVKVCSIKNNVFTIFSNECKRVCNSG